MPRDQEILMVFEVADDGMQGVVGYWLYGKACKQAARATDIQSNLPARLPMTHSWHRNYDLAELTSAMNRLYEPYHARVALISIIGVFEAAIKGFTEKLKAAGKLEQPVPEGYKARLKWTFEIALQSENSSQEVINLIPDLCLDIDNARRIRNLWMHNNGLFDERYLADCIPVPGREPAIDTAFQRFREGEKQVPVVMNPDSFLHISRSHIEVLHHIHNTIQRIYYEHEEPYNYRETKKHIEWQRLLLGT